MGETLNRQAATQPPGERKVLGTTEENVQTRESRGDIVC